MYLITNANKYKYYERWATANDFPMCVQPAWLPVSQLRPRSPAAATTLPSAAAAVR